MMNRNPFLKVVEVASRYVGLRETSRNRGGAIPEFWEETSYPLGDENREPWCCAFVTFCVKTADRESEEFALRKPPTTASCAEFLRWAQGSKECVTFGPGTKGMVPQAGDIVVYLPRLSHIGIVERDYAGDGVIHTIEGNTDDGGSREGDGVYRRTRKLSFAGTFIRLIAAKKVTA